MIGSHRARSASCALPYPLACRVPRVRSCLDAWSEQYRSRTPIVSGQPGTGQGRRSACGTVTIPSRCGPRPVGHRRWGQPTDRGGGVLTHTHRGGAPTSPGALGGPARACRCRCPPHHQGASTMKPTGASPSTESWRRVRLARPPADMATARAAEATGPLRSQFATPPWTDWLLRFMLPIPPSSARTPTESACRGTARADHRADTDHADPARDDAAAVDPPAAPERSPSTAPT